MTRVTRLTLVSHGMTDAMAAGRFPADEALNDIGRSQVKAVAGLDVASYARHLAGPERRACQTAKLLGLPAVAEPRLGDVDCGRWRGQDLSALPSAELEAWLREPARAPHGGESIADLVVRVARWLEALTLNPLRTIAVTHPAVIRAAILVALDIPATSFWRIDIAPLSRTVMHFRNDRWTLRL